MLGKKCNKCGKYTYSKLGKRIMYVCTIFLILSLSVMGLYFVKMGTMAKAFFEVEMRVFNDFDWIVSADTSELTDDCMSQVCIGDRLTQYVQNNSPENMVCRHRGWALKELLIKHDIEARMVTLYEFISVDDESNFFGHVMVEFTDEFNQTWLCDPMNEYYCYEKDYYLHFAKHWLLEEMSPSSSLGEEA